MTDDPAEDAARAAALFALDPAALGGVALRALPGPAREGWLAALRTLLPPEAPLRRVPLYIGPDRLLGGLDLAATLRAGRPVAERGVLAAAHGGAVILAMAERLPPATAAQIATALDTGEVRLERDGLAFSNPCRIGVVALDEGLTPDERPPAALLERLALHLDLTSLGRFDPRPFALSAARTRLPTVRASDDVLTSFCAAAHALGIGSLRAPLLALTAARAAAALAGRDAVADEDAALAARLVLAPRATRLPAPEEAPPPEPPPESDAATRERPLEDVVLEAAAAAIPPDLLATLQLACQRATRSGHAGALQHGLRRGRPAGVRRGGLKNGNHLALVETLRAAAPWQPLRRTTGGRRIEIRPDDFRIRHLKERSRTTTIFVVDASGSAALHRLAEAKGAIELLLAECYVRRDRVALLTFRGQRAELLLPPTRSLARARRSLAALAGGGGTPLATALDAVGALADGLCRSGDTPLVVLLTDGHANIARDGSAGRARAAADAIAAAGRLRALNALLIDTAPRPQPQARRLAEAMSARYVPLPHADAARLSQAIHAVQHAA